MWETRSVFQGLWAAVGNRREAPSRKRCGFPPLSTARHFHGAPGLCAESGTEFADAAHELTLGAPHFQRCIGVRLKLRELLEPGERHIGPQETFATWRFLQQLPRRGPARVDAAALAVGCDDHSRHRARAMKVDVRIEKPAVKRIHRLGMLCADVAEAEVFANHGAV